MGGVEENREVSCLFLGVVVIFFYLFVVKWERGFSGVSFFSCFKRS